MPRRPPPSSSPRPAASRRHRAARGSAVEALDRGRGRRIVFLAARVWLVVGQIGADHEQGLGPAPQALQHLRDLVGRRIADQQRHEREVAEHRLEERQLDLERMLRLMRRVRHLVPAAGRGSPRSPPDRAARRRAASEKPRRSARRRRGTARSAPARSRPRGGSPMRRRRARRTHVRPPARSRRSRHAARSPLWARMRRATICCGEVALDRGAQAARIRGIEAAGHGGRPYRAHRPPPPVARICAKAHLMWHAARRD